jgi:hypothetical protein
MNRPLRIASLLALLVTMAVPAAASAAPKPKQGTAIVFQRGFDVMYWDTFKAFDGWTGATSPRSPPAGAM